MIVSTPPLRAWFAPFAPWPWFRGERRKDAVGSGTPQLALASNAGRHGFNPACRGASNSSGLAAGAYPATVGAILNLSAASIASSGAFLKSNRQ